MAKSVRAVLIKEICESVGEQTEVVIECQRCIIENERATRCDVSAFSREYKLQFNSPFKSYREELYGIFGFRFLTTKVIGAGK